MSLDALEQRRLALINSLTKDHALTKQRFYDLLTRRAVRTGASSISNEDMDKVDRFINRAAYATLIPVEEVLQRCNTTGYPQYQMADIFYSALTADCLLSYQSELILYAKSVEDHADAIGDIAIEEASRLYGVSPEVYYSYCIKPGTFKWFLDEVESIPFSGMCKVMEAFALSSFLQPGIDQYPVVQKMERMLSFGFDPNSDHMACLSELPGSEYSNYHKIMNRKPVLHPTVEELRNETFSVETSRRFYLDPHIGTELAPENKKKRRLDEITTTSALSVLSEEDEEDEGELGNKENKQ